MNAEAIFKVKYEKFEKLLKMNGYFLPNKEKQEKISGNLPQKYKNRLIA